MKDHREIPLDLSGEEFREIGHQLIDSISDFINSINEKPLTTGESPEQIQKILGKSSIPRSGQSANVLISKITDLLLNHSLLNGHPKFMGYITGSPAPIGALADLLASTVNPNVGAHILSPVATEIEKQTISWLAEFIGVSPDYGGLLVSGGNMANFTAFLTGRTVKAPKSIREEGVIINSHRLTVYCSKATHTWIEKAAILFGHGSKAIRWIPTDYRNRINTRDLENLIIEDKENGLNPFMVIGNAGDVSTGAIDNLKAISSICKAHDLWFHVDGAYGILAAVIPELKSAFEGIDQADSIALDPHKWLYSPLEAGCVLIKNPSHLIETFSYHPVYYNFKDNNPLIRNYYEYGLQNSRGFRALKVWLILQQAGRDGYVRMIRKNIELSKYLFELADKHSELEAVSQSLSITTLRYVPSNLPEKSDREVYLNKLNEALLNELEQGGELFLSHADILGKYCLRGCIVNFRTSGTDIDEIIEIIVSEGKKLHEKLWPDFSSQV